MFNGTGIAMISSPNQRKFWILRNVLSEIRLKVPSWSFLVSRGSWIEHGLLEGKLLSTKIRYIIYSVFRDISHRFTLIYQQNRPYAHFGVQPKFQNRKKKIILVNNDCCIIIACTIFFLNLQRINVQYLINNY